MDAPEAGPGLALDETALLERSKVFCVAPWTHLHVLPTGDIFPCCMSAHEPANAVGNCHQGDSLETAWNSGAMRALRLRMLADEGSTLCERCYRGEAVGQDTWRTSQNRQMAHHFPVVRRTRADGGLDELNLPYLDIRFSNVCNLRCRICAPHLSSRWHGDAVSLEWLSPDAPAILRATADPEELWRQIAPLVPGLERFHFAGGEPLVMEEHYRLLQMLLDHGSRDVRLSYNTNLSTLTFKQFDVLAFWKDFRRIYVQASLDGMGARGDYMRKGQNWETVVRNRQRMLAECPHVEFCVLPTVSSMNVLHMPEFYRTLVETGFISPAEFQLNILSEPEHFNLRGLPAAVQMTVTETYRAFIDTYLSTLGEPGQRARGHFEAVLQYMEGGQLDVRNDFVERTAELDLLRRERFLDVFPELTPLASADAFDAARARVSDRFAQDGRAEET